MKAFDPKEFFRRNVSTNFHDSSFSVIAPIIHEDQELQQKMRSAINGKRIIELGCCDLVRYCLDLFAMGAGSYAGVDPYHIPDISAVRKWFMEMGFDKMKDKKIEYYQRDALSYLQSLPSSDGIMTFSSGTLEGDIIHDEKYARQVVQQIARLSRPKETTAIHVVDPFFAGLFQEEGLHLDFGKRASNGFTLGLYSKTV